MKEAIGGIPIFQIVVVFILLFTAVMCLTINHSKAFAVKDEIITIIENRNLESANDASSLNIGSDVAKEIAEYLNKSGYRITGTCPDGFVGYDRSGSEIGKNANFCVKAHDVANSYYSDIQDKCKGSKCTPAQVGYPKMVYYEIVLFYQLDIPIIGEAWNFRIYGSTKTLYG